jgi:hypothetical protein
MPYKPLDHVSMKIIVAAIVVKADLACLPDKR